MAVLRQCHNGPQTCAAGAIDPFPPHLLVSSGGLFWPGSKIRIPCCFCMRIQLVKRQVADKVLLTARSIKRRRYKIVYTVAVPQCTGNITIAGAVEELSAKSMVAHWMRVH